MKKYIIDDIEYTMFGDYVAVCQMLLSKNGSIIFNGNPFIDFVDIREYKGEFYIDEDSPFTGGLGPEFAMEISNSLKKAAEYIFNNFAHPNRASNEE